MDLNVGVGTIFPRLLHPFFGTALGLESPGAEVHYFAAIPGEYGLDIWHPGDPEYDRHPDLWHE